MRPVLLGIDAGTSTCKAAVVDAERGNELAHGRAATPWRQSNGRTEADPHTFFGAVRSAAQAALAAIPDGRVLAVGVTSIAEAGVLLDVDGQVLAPVIAWHDARGTDQARALREQLGAEAFTRRTGLPPTELCSVAKLRWLIDHGSLERAPRRWCNVAEWVVRCLGGREVSEFSLASRTGMLDLSAQAPYTDALDWATLPRDLLGELVWAGTPAGIVDRGVLPGAGGATLTVSGMDHLCAGVGVGVVTPGDVLDSCGTAEALVRVLAPPLGGDAVARSVSHDITVGWHLAPGRQALLGAIWSGLALQEVHEALWRAGPARHGSPERLNEPALDLNLHSAERRPLRLPARVPNPSIWRSAVATVSTEVERLLEVMDSLAGPRRRVVAAGGWLHDPAVAEAKRSLEAELVSGVVEAGARGAALVGGIAAGAFPSVDRLPLPAGQ